MRLQARLFFIVLYQKRQILGPVILKVPRQVLVHVVLCYWDVKVGVQVARVLWKANKAMQRKPKNKMSFPTNVLTFTIYRSTVD